MTKPTPAKPRQRRKNPLLPDLRAAERRADMWMERATALKHELAMVMVELNALKVAQGKQTR